MIRLGGGGETENIFWGQMEREDLSASLDMIFLVAIFEAAKAPLDLV